MKFPLSAVVAVISGIIVLAGYFIPVAPVQQVSNLLLNWAVIIVATAVLVGVFSLIGVHWQKMQMRRNPDRYSIIVILVFIATVAAGLVTGGPAYPGFQNIINYLQVPIESSLMAILTFTLALACLRLFKNRTNLMIFVFAGSAILFLILYSGILAANPDIPYVKDLLGIIHRLPISGSRGILLGIALGSLLTGLRVLFGVDRPYNG